MLRQELEGPWSDIDPSDTDPSASEYVCIQCGRPFIFGGDETELPYDDTQGGCLCDACSGFEPEPPTDADLQFLIGQNPQPATLNCDCCDVVQPGSAFTLGGAGYAVPGTTVCNTCTDNLRLTGSGGERPTCPACGVSLAEYGFCHPCRSYYAPLPPAEPVP